MTPILQAKFEEILKGNLKYVSSNLALNMLISRLQRKAIADPRNMAAYIRELDEFVTRYAAVMGEEFDMIAAL